MPLAAAAAVVVVLLWRPQEYQATATVATPTLIGEVSPYTGPSAVKTFVADFIAVAQAQAVLDKVAKANGVTPDGLSVSAVNTNGSLVKVTYRTQHQAKAAPVVQAVAKEAIAFLFQAPVELAQRRVDEARKTVDQIQAQIDAFSAQTGLLVPDRDYQAKTQELATLEVQEIQAAAEGQGTVAARLKEAVAAKRAELAALAPHVRSYATLVDQKARASERLDAATQALGRANARREAGDSPTVVAVGQARPIARDQELLRKVMTAVSAAVFLGIGLIILLEAIDRRGRGVEQPSSSDDAATPFDDMALEPAVEHKQNPGSEERLLGSSDAGAQAKGHRVRPR